MQYNLLPVGAQKIVPAKTLLQYAGPTELEFPVYERKQEIVDDDEVVCIQHTDTKNTKKKRKKESTKPITTRTKTTTTTPTTLYVRESNIQDAGKGLFTKNSFI